MTKLAGCLVVLAACGYPALPAVGEHDAATQADAQEVDAAIDAGAGSELPPANPRVDVSIAGPITTELMTVNPALVTVRGSNGFAGTVTLAIQALDPSGNVIPTWTVALDDTSIDVPLDGSAQTNATFVVPAKRVRLDGTIKVTLTVAGADGTHTATSAVTVRDQVSWATRVPAGTTSCMYPANGGTTVNPVVIALDTKVRLVNSGGTALQFHASGIMTHPAADTPPGGAYEQVPTGVGTMSWYCHAPGPNLGADNPTFVVQ
jgi:hypothetical protein